MPARQPVLSIAEQTLDSDPLAESFPRSSFAAPLPALLNEAQAAAFFGVSKRTFLSLRSASWMPRAIVLGPRLHRWSFDELRAAVALMPRATQQIQPEALLRYRVERLKTTGTAE